MTGATGLFAAFGAGMISFFSACVLPLVPGYVSFLASLSAGEKEPRRRDAIVQGLLFVAGFTVVFVVLGTSASLLGALVGPYRRQLAVIGGVVIVLFGVLLLQVIPIPWLYAEARFDPAKSRRWGKWAAPAMGVAFGLGWTPCVGPILGSILMLAASQGGVGRGALLLLTYSAGLALPFVIAAALLDRLQGVVRWLHRYALVVNRISGVVLVVLGLLMATGKLSVVTAWLSRAFAALGWS